MLDNELFPFIIKTIIDQEAVAGIAGTPISQAFQPTGQGVNTEPTAYLYKVGDHRLGSPQRADVYDPVAQKMTHTETQVYESTFQISALATQDPKNQQQFTASDILNFISYILQSDTTIAAFTAKGIGIYKIGDIRNPYFVDDRDRHEASPSFDFIITHKQIVANVIDVIQSTEFQIVPV